MSKGEGVATTRRPGGFVTLPRYDRSDALMRMARHQSDRGVAAPFPGPQRVYKGISRTHNSGNQFIKIRSLSYLCVE